MAMELTDAATHAASGAGGVLSMGLLAKVLIQRWIKERDKMDEDVKGVLTAVGEKLTTVAVELGKIGVKLEMLQRSADASAQYGAAIAVLQTRVDDLGKNLNGLGQKVKSMGSNGA